MAKEIRRRNQRIQVRTTEEEYIKIIKKAKHSLSLNDYMVKMALKGKVVLPTPAIDRETAMQFARIGSNLNQIAHSLHKAEMNILNRKTLKKLKKNMEVLQSALKETQQYLWEKVLKNS